MPDQLSWMAAQSLYIRSNSYLDATLGLYLSLSLLRSIHIIHSPTYHLPIYLPTSLSIYQVSYRSIYIIVYMLSILLCLCLLCLQTCTIPIKVQSSLLTRDTWNKQHRYMIYLAARYCDSIDEAGLINRATRERV